MKQIRLSEKVNLLLRALDSDLKYEVIMTELIENSRDWAQLKVPKIPGLRTKKSSGSSFSLDLEYIKVVSKSIFDRAVKGDVGGAFLEGPSKNKPASVVFEVNRDGFYDSLPPSLFHKAVTEDLYQTSDPKEKLAEANQRNAEEEQARNFFLPFEQEFYRLRVLLELVERKNSSGFLDKENLRIFANLWGIGDDLTEDQLVSLLYLLPYAHKIAGNKKLIALSLEAIFGTSFRIKYETRELEVSEEQKPRLGTVDLGRDFALGGTFFSGIPFYHLEVGPLDENTFPDFLPEGKYFRAMEKCLKFLIPLESEVRTTVILEQESRELRLGDPENSGRLGYNTHLSKVG